MLPANKLYALLKSGTWKYRTRQGTSWCHPNCVCPADKSWHLFWSMQSRSLWWSSSGHLVQSGYAAEDFEERVRFRQPKQKQVILSSNPRLTFSKTALMTYKIPNLTWYLHKEILRIAELSGSNILMWSGCPSKFILQPTQQMISNLWMTILISSAGPLFQAICSISSWVCLKIEDPPNFSRNDPFLDFETSDVINDTIRIHPAGSWDRKSVV